MTPTYAHPLSNILIQLQIALMNMFTFMAGKADDDDKGFEGDDAWDDDSDLGDDDDKGDDDDDSDDDDSDDDDDDDDDDKKKSDKKDKSAIVQKKRYRDQAKKLQKELNDLKSKDNSDGLSAEEKKEQAAKQYLATTIRDVLKEVEKEEQSKSAKEQEAFDEELEEVLDENDSISEKKLRSVAEEFEVNPKVALKIIERERKLTKREKPKIPKEKRASTSISKGDKGGDDKKPSSLDDVARRIKAAISE